MKIKTNAPNIIKWAIETDTILLTKTDQSEGGRKMDTKRISRILTILGLTAVIAFVVVGMGINVRAETPPVTEVHPTGDYPDDLNAIQNAVDLGGTVVLKATNLSGEPTAFNLGDDTTGRGVVQITIAVTILGEETEDPYSVILPNGETLDDVDKPVVYGGGASGFASWPPPLEEVAGTFQIFVPDGYVTIQDITVYEPAFTAIGIAACNGAMIKGNEVLYPVEKPIFPGWSPFYWGITVSEGWRFLGIPCAISGTVTIKDNYIKLKERESWAGIGIFIIEIQPETRAHFVIKNNTIENTPWTGIEANGFKNSTALIKGNRLLGQDISVNPGDIMGDLNPPGKTEICNNTVEAIGLSYANDSVITNNKLTSSGTALRFDYNENCVVKENMIILEGGSESGISMWGSDCHNNIIKENTITGIAEFGIRCEEVHDNVFKENDLEDLEVTQAHVYLDPDTYNNVFVENEPEDMIVIDEGLNNQILDDDEDAAPALLKKFAFAAPPVYPQPSNPETWIPYTLAKDMEVTITIYSSSGRIIRALNLGHQKAGAYISKSRAAYWDGRNENGEKVSSGVYFYTLRAGDFRATRKMVILR